MELNHTVLPFLMVKQEEITTPIVNQQLLQPYDCLSYKESKKDPLKLKPVNYYIKRKK